MSWHGANTLGPRTFTCGFCGKLVASAKGFYTESSPLAQKAGISTEVITGSTSVPKKADRLNSDLATAGTYSKLDQKNVTAWFDPPQQGRSRGVRSATGRSSDCGH